MTSLQIEESSTTSTSTNASQPSLPISSESSVLGSFCLDDWVVIDSLTHPPSFDDITPPSPTSSESPPPPSPPSTSPPPSPPSSWSLYSLVPSSLWHLVDAMHTRLGRTIQALLDHTPAQIKALLARAILAALQLAISGADSVCHAASPSLLRFLFSPPPETAPPAPHIDPPRPPAPSDPASPPSSPQTQGLSFKSSLCLSRASAEHEADLLWQEYGGAEQASRVAFDLYLGSPVARSRLLALDHLPAALGLVCSMYLRIRFFAVVAHLHEFSLQDERVLTLVAFAALDVPVSDPTATVQRQVDDAVVGHVEEAVHEQAVDAAEELAMKELAPLLGAVDEKLRRVAQSLLSHVAKNVAITEIAKYCFGLYMVYSLVQSLKYNDEPLQRALQIFANPDLKEFILKNPIPLEN